jgi:hypothetical protein
MTLNLSKSFNCLLFWSAARFLAQALSSNFCWTLCSSHFFATKPTPVPRGSLGITMGVRESLARATSWRGTGAFSVGPSTRTCVCELVHRVYTAGLAYTLVVDDLDDGSQATLVDTLVEEDHAADLDQPPGARCDIGVTHFVGMCCGGC